MMSRVRPIDVNVFPLNAAAVCTKNPTANTASTGAASTYAAPNVTPIITSGNSTNKTANGRFANNAHFVTVRINPPSAP